MPSPRTTRTFTLSLLAALVVAAGGWLARTSAAGEASPVGRSLLDAEAEGRARDIALYERRAAEDEQSAEDRAQLAALYLQRARETGDEEDVRRAEGAARQSLALRTAHNGKTFVTLASSLLAQHRFVEARDVAARLAGLYPEEPAYRALLGETQVELGDYDAARATFNTVDAVTAPLSSRARLARWAELTGRTDAARRLLATAAEDAGRRAELPREQRAWFHLRAGDLELRAGRLRAAERAFRAGLAVNPEDHRVLAAMARLAAARGDWRRVVDYGDRAIAVALDPATLGLVSDAHAALGDTAKAAEYFRTMEVAVSAQAGPFHRAWSLFLLDHGRRVPEVLARARAEIAVRRDVYGHDLLAWALHKAGRDAEAQAAMTAALALGTQDAMLFRHAAAIERALGREAAARDHERRAEALGR